MYKPYQSNEELSEWLNRSLTADEISDLNGRVPSDEYELITKGTPLPPRILSLRCPPLSHSQWTNFFDEDGRIIESDILKEIVFHGVCVY